MTLAPPTRVIPEERLQLARQAAISGKGGRVATNRMLTRLRHLFAWAIEQHLLTTSPFTKKVIDRKAEGGRTRRLEGTEETRLLRAAGSHLRACIEAALETGMRKAEILGLQWQHVRKALDEIQLPETLTKTGVARQVMITPRLAAILDMRATEQRTMRELAPDADLPSDLYPFGNELGEAIGDCRTAWRLTCKRAGITGLHFHDLRRESGSHLLETGASLADVRDYLHASVTQTNKYLSTSSARLRAALAKRDAARTNLAQPPQPEESADAAPPVTH